MPSSLPQLKLALRSTTRKYAGRLLRYAHAYSPRLFRQARRLWRWTLWAAVGMYFVAALTILSLRYLILPQIDEYRPQIEAAASRAIGLTVHIEDVDADWRGLQPNLTLKQVVVLDREQRPALRLPRISATLSWQSLLVWDVRLARLQIDDADLEIRRGRDGRITVGGIVIDTRSRDDRVAEWLLQQHYIGVRGARVRWTDELRQAPELPLQALNFVLENSGLHHRFAFHAIPPETLAEPLDVRGDFSHPLFAQRVSDYTRWDGTLYLNLHMKDLTAGKIYFDYPVELRSGRGALRAWLDFDAMTVRQMTADVSLANVVTRLRRDLEPLELRRVQGRLGAAYAEQGYRIDLQGFSLRTSGGLQLQNLDMHHAYTAARGGRAEHGEVRINHIDLHVLSNLAAHLPLHARLRQFLRDFDPRGTLHELQAGWQGHLLGESGAPGLSYRLDTRFTGLTSHEQLPADTMASAAPASPSRRGIPGFSNLSGHVRLSDQNGTLVLDSKETSLTFPGVFAEPQIPLDWLTGKIDWKLHGAQYDIRIDQLAFANPDAEGTLKGSYRRDEAGVGVADLQGALTRALGVRAERYLPTSLPATRRWMRQAVKAGFSDDVQFVLRGALQDFPFIDPKKGEFRVAVKVKDGALLVDPAWPMMENIKADLIFERQTLRASASEATVAGVKILKSQIAIDDLGAAQPMLQGSGNASGALQDMLGFINNSPVLEWTNRFTETAQASGNARAELTLALPVNNSARATLTGALQFAGNDITLDQGLPPLQRTQGRIDFTENSLRVRNVSGTLMGGILRLESDAQDSGAIRLDGNVTAQGLQRAYPSSFTQRLAGETRYHGKVVLRQRIPAFQIDSTLAGLAINLPAPLHKTAREALPLRIENLGQIAGMEAQKAPAREEMRVALGRAIRIRLERERDGKGQMRLRRGVLAVNENPVLPEAGLAARINLRSINYDEWRPLLNGPEGGEGAEDLGLSQIALRTEEVQAYGRKFHNVTLNASRSANNWQANLAADQLAGTLAWRPAEGTAATLGGKLTARLSRLQIQPGVGDTSLGETLDDMPALDIVADDFILSGKHLGRMELTAINTGTAANHVWRIQKLNLSNSDASFAATGTWGREAFTNTGARKVALHFSLDMTNAGKLLERFGQKGAISHGEGRLEGDVSWRGVPFAIDYPSLNGKLQLAVDKGQFLKADPGISKLLGVLSLQALPRRITLDFRDVFSEGFAFDSVRAKIDVNNGIASTGDFKMRGVAATVLMEGNVDLAQETQKLHLIVLPEISGGVATLAWGLLANPAVGVASYLAQLLLKEPLARAFSYEYSVSGSWAEPNVVKLERKRAAQE